MRKDDEGDRIAAQSKACQETTARSVIASEAKQPRGVSARGLGDAQK